MDITKTYIPKKFRSDKLNGGISGTVTVSQQTSQQGNPPPSIIEHSQLKNVRSILDDNLPEDARDIHLSKEAAYNLKKLAEGLFLIAKEDITTIPADDNTFSALRTLFEIANNNEELKKIFLRKDLEDSAKEKITFEKGFVSDFISKFVSGVELGNYTSGALGSGGAFKMNNGVSELEVDKLTVRMVATFFELVISKLRHVGGQIVLSPAQIKCTRVVDGGSYYRCYFNTGENGEVANEFVEGDQARCQTFSGSGAKFYWRLVTSVGTDYINLSKSDKLGDGVPTAGDDIIQLGHRTNPERQNAQILSTVGADAPSYKQYAGINSFSLEGKELNVISSKGNKFVGVTQFLAGSSGLENIPAFVDVKNRKVGVRNLLRNSRKKPSGQGGGTAVENADGTVTITITEGNSYNYYGGLSRVVNNGEEITISIRLKKIGAISGNVEWYLNSENSYVEICPSNAISENYTIISNTRTKVGNNEELLHIHYPSGVVQIDWIMVTLGNQPSVEWTEAPEDVQERINIERAYVNAIKSDLQSQIDGNISSFFYDYEPTLSNIPASSWSSDSVREIHLGDLFYWTSKGWAYRFQKVNGVFSWTRIEDTDVTKALADAARAQDTADGKRTTFITQPAPPYERGDLWAQGAGGELMRCVTSRSSGAFTASDWEKASKYTDDTAVNNLKIGVQNVIRRGKIDYKPEMWGETSSQVLSDSSYSYIHSDATGIVLYLYNKDKFKNNDEICVSITAKTADIDKSLNFSILYGDGSNRWCDGSLTFTTEWTTQNIVVRIANNINVNASQRLYIYPRNRWIDIANVMIVKGNVVPQLFVEAPEDVQERIAQAKQAGIDAQNAVIATNQNVTNLNGYVNGAFKDGIIQNAEKVAIEKYLNTVSESRLSIQSSYSQLYNNSYLEGTPKSNLESAKTTFETAVTNLVNSINTAIADGATTPVEKADVDAKFNLYNTALATYQVRVEEAKKSIEDKLKGYADAAQATANNAQTTANNALTKATTVEAIANKSKAITDKFGTTVEGGLIQSVMMLLRDFNSQTETAGISGIQGTNKDKPAFWSGGTYAEALEGLANIILYHNSRAKIGVFNVGEDGKVRVMDLEIAGLVRLLISQNNLPEIINLFNDTTQTATVNMSGWDTNVAGIGNYEFTDVLSVPYGDSKINLSGQVTLNCIEDIIPRVYLYINLYKKNANGIYEEYCPVDMFSTTNNFQQTFGYTVTNVPVGDYKVAISYSISPEGSISVQNLSMNYVHNNDVRRIEFGRDGFMAFFNKNSQKSFLHLTEQDGMIMGGKTDIPGVLASGSILSSGIIRNAWGAKVSSDGAIRQSIGVYRIRHMVGHSNYTLSINCHTENCNVSINDNYRKAYEVEIIINRSGSRFDSGFDFEIYGKNFA